LLHPNLVALGVLALQLLPADFTTLSEGDVERLRADHLVVHLRHSLRSFLGRREANKSEAFGMLPFVSHHLATGNGTKRLELGTQLLVVHVVFQIFDVQIDALILAELLHLGLFIRLAQFFLTFGFLLSTGDEEFLATKL
jgi:hypothetical protein